jgi:hypothetical protein
MVGSSLEEQAIAALEASHHAELVEALRAATAQLMLIPNSAASEARRVAVIDCASALLAKLGGDS